MPTLFLLLPSVVSYSTQLQRRSMVSTMLTLCSCVLAPWRGLGWTWYVCSTDRMKPGIDGLPFPKMDLSTLGSLQQGILFALLILGHAFPVFAFISLLRAISFRTALNDAPTEEKGDQAVPQMPILQLEEKIGCCKEDSFPAKLIDKAKVRMAVREVQADIGLWNGNELCAATDPQHPDETQRGSFVGANNKTQNIGGWKAHIRSLISWFKDAVHRSANYLSCRDSMCCNAPDGINYMALCLITGLVMLYFIGFLILGIVTIGLWSKFVRPDIPREDKTSPFWAGAFLATSALCNNGMSLIDTNMGPYQKEWVILSFQKIIFQRDLLTQPPGPFPFSPADFSSLLEILCSPAYCASSSGCWERCCQIIKLGNCGDELSILLSLNLIRSALTYTLPGIHGLCWVQSFFLMPSCGVLSRFLLFTMRRLALFQSTSG